jgi:DNA polymerase-3 subunit gamma/tau
MVGQEHVLQALINALDNDRLHHAYLFTGTRGVGKTTIARILAKCLNCERGVSSEPCGECASCQEIAEGRSVDLLEVDAASRTKVEDTRELLENVQYAPTRSRYKVYLIDEVHMLSTHSFNALLKTLEEPPPHVKFLLATTDPQKLPATILSRCLQSNLKNMPPEQIVGHLKHILASEGVTFEEAALWLLGRAAAGSMRDALSLTDQAIAFGSGALTEQDVRSMLGCVDLSFVYPLLETVAAGEPAEVLAIVARMAEHAPDFEGSLDELISLLHRVAVAQAVPEAIDNSWGDAERVAQIAASLTAEDVQLYYQVALNGKRDLVVVPEPRSGFEMVLLRMIAFRPAAVIDESLGPDDLLEVQGAAAQEAAVGEVGDAVKKSPELRSGADRGGESATLQPAPGQSSQPHSQPAAPPPAAATDTMGSSALSPEGWPVLLDQLGLVGIVHNIAAHCELRARQGDALEFILDEAHSSLFNDSHADKIRLALENYFDAKLSVSIVPGQVLAETPAGRAERLRQERQSEAVAEIEADTQLQALIARFDGELDRASITPLDS